MLRSIAAADQNEQFYAPGVPVTFALVRRKGLYRARSSRASSLVPEGGTPVAATPQKEVGSCHILAAPQCSAEFVRGVRHNARGRCGCRCGGCHVRPALDFGSKPNVSPALHSQTAHFGGGRDRNSDALGRECAAERARFDAMPQCDILLE